MTLAGARVATQQNLFGAFEVAAFGEGSDAGGRDVRRLGEVELFQRLDPGQVCFVHAQFDESPFPLVDHGLEQGLKVVEVRVVALRGFVCELCGLRTKGWQSQCLAVLSDACGLDAGGAVHACTACMLPEKSRSYSIMVGNGRS